MHVELTFLIIGLIGLWVGSDRLIKGITDFATRVGMSHFFVGIAFVSIGTSLPEIAVSIAGAISTINGVDASGLVLGNAVGSALTQISFFIGAMALITPLYMKRKEVLRHGGMLITAILLVFGLGIDGKYQFWDGIIMVLAYLAYYIITIISEDIDGNDRPPLEWRVVLKDILWSVIGLGVVLISSDIVVENSIVLASTLGVSQSVIGILLVGFGTGLPEFAIALASVRKRVMSIGVAELLGSNICDLLLSLGLGSMIAEFAYTDGLHTFDFPVLLLFASALLAFWYTRQKITRLEGAILLGLYLIYVAIKLFAIA